MMSIDKVTNKTRLGKNGFKIAPSYYPPVSEASRGVYLNQAQKNFTHPYTEQP